jgi:hypothetical protein
VDEGQEPDVSASAGLWTQQYLVVAGRRAAFSICYEDLLWWSHWRLLVDRHDVLICMSNGWFNFDLALAHAGAECAVVFLGVETTEVPAHDVTRDFCKAEQFSGRIPNWVSTPFSGMSTTTYV